jgi:hypothetical protein
MARTQTRKETVTECGAPSSKLKALQEIIEDESSLLPIHKASSSSIQSSCIKPHLQTPKAPLLTSKSLLEECALPFASLPSLGYKTPKMIQGMKLSLIKG